MWFFLSLTRSRQINVFKSVFNSSNNSWQQFSDKFLEGELKIYQRQLAEQFTATTCFSFQMNAKDIIHNVLSEAKNNNQQNFIVIKQEADKICKF